MDKIQRSTTSVIDLLLSCGFLTYQFFRILLDEVFTEPDEHRSRLF